MKKLTGHGGRLKEQRDYGYNRLKEIPGLSCVEPRGAFYFFPKLDAEKFNIKDDERFVLDLLRNERILVVQGTGFNWVRPDHFRIVFLPEMSVLERAFNSLEDFLMNYQQD